MEKRPLRFLYYLLYFVLVNLAVSLGLGCFNTTSRVLFIGAAIAIWLISNGLLVFFVLRKKMITVVIIDLAVTVFAITASYYVPIAIQVKSEFDFLADIIVFSIASVIAVEIVYVVNRRGGIRK